MCLHNPAQVVYLISLQKGVAHVRASTVSQSTTVIASVVPVVAQEVAGRRLGAQKAIFPSKSMTAMCVESNLNLRKRSKHIWSLMEGIAAYIVSQSFLS